MEIGETGFVNPYVFEQGKIDELAHVGSCPTPGFLEIERVSKKDYRILRTC